MRPRTLHGVGFAGVLLAAALASAQDAQFGFDPHGNLLLEMAENPAIPKILAPPQMQVVQPGQLASFSVIAADTRGLSYQWFFNGTNLAGATSDSLLLTGVSVANQGPYSVVLSNASGSVTSSVAQLYIDSRGVGMPDSWQLAYFGNLNQNPTGDFDGDGVSNLQEFLDGTNPTNSASALFRLNIVNTGALVTESPTQTSYTNGQTVTLTATGIGNYNFRSWGGDIGPITNNPLTLTMTNNKTVVAYAGPYNLLWTNAVSGDWFNPSNWLPNLVPGPYDTVGILSNVTVTINSSPADCGSLTLQGSANFPAIAGSNTLTLHADSTFKSGSLTGSGVTVISPGVAVSIPNASTFFITGRTLENGGTINWTGSGTLQLDSGAVLTNRPGAMFNSFKPSSLTAVGGSNSRFDNAGTFQCSPGAGTFNLVTPFNNYGLVALQSGTLYCNYSFLNNGTVTLAAGGTNILAGGGSATGSFSVPSTALLQWTGNAFTPAFTLSGGAQLNGSGWFQISGETLNVNTDIAVNNLDLPGATINGTGNIIISNVMNWTSATITGNGSNSLLISPGAVLNFFNPGTVFLFSRMLDNAGTVFWSGTGGMQVDSMVITNRPGALFLVQNSTSLGGGSSRFDNAGIFRKTTSAGTTAVAVTFNNYATIDVQTGTLNCSGVFNNNASVLLAPGTTNIISGGGSASGSFTNPPTALVQWTGTAFTPAFALNPGAQLNGSGFYQVSGETLNLNADISVANLDLPGATLNGSGNLTIGSVMNWTSATINGNGNNSLLISPGAVLNLFNPGTVFLFSRMLDNAGTVFWSGTGGMQVGSMVVTNRPGALFLVQNSATLGGGSSRFDNAGTFRKTTSAGTTAVAVTFNNYATIDVQTGTLNCSGVFNNNASVLLGPGTTNIISGGGSASGSFSNPATALVQWTGTAFTPAFALNPGAQLNGGGFYQVIGETMNLNTNILVQNLDLPGATLNGAGNLTIGSVMNWTSATINGNGANSLVISPGAVLNFLNSGTVFLFSRTLDNSGTVLWTGAGGLQGDTMVITNRPGALFQMQNSATVSGSSSRFDNDGMFRKVGNAGTITLAGYPFNNHGTVDIQTGILQVNSGYNSSANALLNCGLAGTTAGAQYGQLTVPSSITLTGRLSVTFTNGFIPATNATFTLVSAGGTRNGAFASFSYPSNLVSMQMSNTANSVLAQVTGVVVPIPVLLLPSISGSNVLLSWTAVSNINYRLEFVPNLPGTNWTAIPGDVTSQSNLATKLDQLTNTNRFYRVQVVP